MNEKNWQDLMMRLDFDPNLDTYYLLSDAYREKHRAYHTIDHLEAVLLQLENASAFADNYEAVELALWFHDCVYQPRSSDNELKSAELATHFLTKNNADKFFMGQVHSLIMSTQHDATPMSRDQQLVVDIDLTILGAPQLDYMAYLKAVRKEYRIVPWFIYRKKRKEILEHFLNRERIYSHDYFYNKYEKSARLNLINEVDRLS